MLQYDQWVCLDTNKTYCGNLVLSLSSTQFSAADIQESWMKFSESMKFGYLYFSLIH